LGRVDDARQRTTQADEAGQEAHDVNGDHGRGTGQREPARGGRPHEQGEAAQDQEGAGGGAERAHHDGQRLLPPPIGADLPDAAFHHQAGRQDGGETQQPSADLRSDHGSPPPVEVGHR
jgi:hypothetical protein